MPTNLSPVYADADPNFFKVKDKWTERFVYQGVNEFPADDRVGFLEDQDVGPKYRGQAAQYFSEDDPSRITGANVLQPARPYAMSLEEIRLESRTYELELEQVATIRGRGIQRFAATSPDKIDFFKQSSDELQMQGKELGTTYVHVWDTEGRVTIPIQVIPQQRIVEYTRMQTERVEQGESFKVQYTQNRDAFYDGNGYRDLQRTSLTYSQGFEVWGDTPYGALSGQGQIQEFDNKTELTTISAQLTDAKIGPYEDFNLAAGDFSITPNMHILPSGRFRGGAVDYYGNETSRQRFQAFYGRERASLLGTLLSGGQQASLDSFVGGGIYDFDLTEAANWRFGYAQAYGQERRDELNNNAVEWEQNYQLSDVFRIKSNLGYDDAHTAYDVQGIFASENLNFITSYRDISKKFFTIIGNPGGQGEQGVRFDMNWNAAENLELRYSSDVYRDRLFFFPGAEDQYNWRQNGDMRWTIDDVSSVTVDFQDNEETALLSPFRDRTYGVSYNRSERIWNNPFSWYARLQHQDNESLTSPDAFYRRQTLSAGAQMPLPLDFYFSYQHSISILEETNLGALSHPRSMTYTLSRRSRVAETPLYADMDIRYTDEEETESLRSFMIGEDRLEITGSLRYEIENIELFVDGRYTSINVEDRRNEYRTEAEVITGVRYLFDTGIRWETKGKFFGYVFNDANEDGMRQGDEPGIPGMEISVGQHRVMTDDQGYFETPPVTGKSAVITLDSNKIPPGFAGTSSFRREIALSDAGNPVFFGLAGRSEIVGVVFNDLNGDGRFDRQDAGIEAAKIVLNDGAASRSTERSGVYRFSDASEGEHRVMLDIRSLPQGYLPSGKYTKQITLYKGVRYEANFPVVSQRVISGRVFRDDNANGIADAGEAGAGGMEVRLGDLRVTTDEEGYYLFENIPPGTYTLMVSPDAPRGMASEFSKNIQVTGKPLQESVDIPVKTIAF